MASRKSRRLQNAEVKKGIDEATLKKRMEKAIENLEKDNYAEDPQPDLVLECKHVPKESAPGRRTRSKKANMQRWKLAEYFKTRFNKTFDQLVEEECAKNPDGPNYKTAQAPKSIRPPKKLCAVCGFFSNYVCTICSARYCSIKCKEIHNDTRCLKWVV